MSVVTVPQYTSRKYRKVMTVGLIALLILIFLIGMSLAAVAEMTGYCRKEQQAVLLHSGGCLLLHQGGCLLLNQTREQCYIKSWGLKIEPPEGTVTILRKFGVPFFQI